MIKTKKSQEEMVGFGIIIGIVAIILLVFLWFTFTGNRETSTDSYKAESFLQASLQYTTECGGTREPFLSLKDLIFECDRGRSCTGGQDSCNVLTTTMANLLEKGWKGEGSIKGYVLNITVDGANVTSFMKGNITSTSRGAIESFSKSGALAELRFKIYS